jgi:adenosylmethionine-8-amino-7-oxononanoate aminotransferase
MRTADDIGRLKQEAIETIVFHATPREWLRQIGGPWVLERGEGALLHDVEGREYLDALSGGVFAVLVGYGGKRSPGPCTTRRCG